MGRSEEAERVNELIAAPIVHAARIHADRYVDFNEFFPSLVHFAVCGCCYLCWPTFAHCLLHFVMYSKHTRIYYIWLAFNSLAPGFSRRALHAFARRSPVSRHCASSLTRVGSLRRFNFATRRTGEQYSDICEKAAEPEILFSE